MPDQRQTTIALGGKVGLTNVQKKGQGLRGLGGEEGMENDGCTEVMVNNTRPEKEITTTKEGGDIQLGGGGVKLQKGRRQEIKRKKKGEFEGVGIWSKKPILAFLKSRKGHRGAYLVMSKAKKSKENKSTGCKTFGIEKARFT